MIKQFSQFVFRQFLNNYPSTGIRKFYTTFCFYTRNLLIKMFKDPVIDYPLGGKKVKMNLSYNLPIMLKDRPYYNSCLPRLSQFVNSRQKHLTFIDVGANIGDTVILIDEKAKGGKYLCVEGSDFYYNILEQNAKLYQQVTCVKALCDEHEHKVNVSLDVIGDSAVVGKSSGNEVVTTTIDALIEKHPEFKNTNIYKIDTDGYDYKVIRGSEKLISSSSPILFFEFSPNHLIEAGEDPLSIFEYLMNKGYKDMLLYDRFGYLFMKVKLSEKDLIKRLIDFTTRKKGEYFDILTFPSKWDSDFEDYYKLELDLFNKNS